jgi:hypothetical protein
MSKKELFVWIRGSIFIILVLLYIITNRDISVIQRYIIDICITLISIVWTVVEVYEYERRKNEDN